MSRIFIIGGPTASGKSALAIELAQKTNGVVLNGDALQIYADLSILSARPQADDLTQAPHQLYGVLDGAERGSVALWLTMVHEAITAALNNNQTPIVVGGTGMYLRALIQGIANIPTPPAELVSRLGTEYDAIGGDAFKARLAALDPQSATTLLASDRQRLIRAHAVASHTGQPLGSWQAQPNGFLPSPDWQLIPAVIDIDRAKLYERCNLRFELMLNHGALDEVKTLLSRQLEADLPVLKAVGVPELSDYLSGKIELSEAIRLGQQATRHYAKRQLTWFRNQMPEAKRIFRANDLISTL